jgi:hypothetical protein
VEGRHRIGIYPASMRVAAVAATWDPHETNPHHPDAMGVKSYDHDNSCFEDRPRSSVWPDSLDAKVCNTCLDGIAALHLDNE